MCAYPLIPHNFLGNDVTMPSASHPGCYPLINTYLRKLIEWKLIKIYSDDYANFTISILKQNKMSRNNISRYIYTIFTVTIVLIFHFIGVTRKHNIIILKDLSRIVIKIKFGRQYITWYSFRLMQSGETKFSVL